MATNNQEEIINRARRDLAQRLGVDESGISVASADDVEFPDAALGAAVEGEMSAQVITPGCRIRLSAQDEDYEYRAAGTQVRLVNFRGRNYRL
jgi:hypothetical protein